MVIGIDASRANREHRTGTEWYSYYLIRWLAKLDKTNQYILYTDEPLKQGLLDLSTAQYYPEYDHETIRFDDEGYQIIKSPHNNFKAKHLKWPFRYFWTQGRLSLEMLTRPIDLLFVPAHTLPVIHPKKTIVTIHDIAFENENRLYEKENIVSGSRRANWLPDLLVKIATANKYRANKIDYLRWSTQFALKHATGVITVSEYTKTDLIKTYQADPHKLNVIYNGYNRDLYKDLPANKNILIKYNITEPYLFYVGRIERKKNIPALIESFAILKQSDPSIKHKLVLAGNASYGYDETKYMIEEFGLEREVMMTGWVDETDLPYLYRSADAFVFPSIYEGFGIPLLQAMACGIPIAASNSTSIPEIVGDAALLFDPKNVTSMADAMHRIIKDEKLRGELRLKSTARVAKFSWQKCAELTLKLINML